jgi:hypothetical protein
MIARMAFLFIVIAMLVVGCNQNKAATEACKGQTSVLRVRAPSTPAVGLHPTPDFETGRRARGACVS